MADTIQADADQKRPVFQKTRIATNSLIESLLDQRGQRLTKRYIGSFTTRELEDLGLARRDIDSSIGRH